MRVGNQSAPPQDMFDLPAASKHSAPLMLDSLGLTAATLFQKSMPGNEEC